MIEFVTLILGLVTGTQTVEVSVGPEVAGVELRLDGQAVGKLSGEHWRFDCDFGEELAPHELVAIARDDKGHELGRARQLINLPRERAEARFALEPGRGRGPPTARLIWQALDFERPVEVSVTFDGQDLPVTDPGHIELPSHSPEDLHFLSAELVFSHLVATHAELVFGGRFGDEVSTELTAVMASLEGKSPPQPEKMQGWLLKDGRPLRIVAVEQGPMDLLIVRMGSAAMREGLKHLAGRRRRGPASEHRRLGEILEFNRRDRVRYVFPYATQRAKTELVTEMFPVSVNTTRQGDLFQLLTEIFFLEESKPPAEQRIADAVAVAGLVAAAGNYRRAVILVYSGDVADVSQYTPAVVRDYLRRLRVPLFVWSLPVGRVSPSTWGEERDISNPIHFREHLLELKDVLDSQVAVWVEGAHMPGEIELAKQATDIRLLD
ncbi:MAG: hypothetical protein GY856_29675 [bacterium]|nr:hypothetical protein [bacterium]